MNKYAMLIIGLGIACFIWFLWACSNAPEMDEDSRDK